MIASISPSLLASGFYWFRMPDISSETKRLINYSKCGIAWTEIHSAFRQQSRTGSSEAKAAAESHRLLCGIRQLAANAGVTPVTMRRQIRRLAELGLIRLEEELPTLQLDPGTGRIISRIPGRRPKPLVICVTLNQSHMKPSRGKKADILEDRNRPTVDTLEDRNGSTLEDRNRSISKRDKELKKEHPTANSYGIGIVLAEKTSRISSKGHLPYKMDQHSSRRKSPYSENLEVPKSWAETDERFLQTMKRLEEEERKREEQNNLWEKERAAMECHS